MIYTLIGDKFHAPLMRVPAGHTFFSLALLRTATADHMMTPGQGIF
jgi:hypothetical protein